MRECSNEENISLAMNENHLNAQLESNKMGSYLKKSGRVRSEFWTSVEFKGSDLLKRDPRHCINTSKKLVLIANMFNNILAA